MKRLNDNVLWSALGGTILFLIILIAANIKGLVGQTTYLVFFIIGLVPALFLLFTLSMRYETERLTKQQAKREASHFNPNKVSVMRTTEGTICEAVTALLLIATLIAGIINHAFTQWGDDSTHWMIVAFPVTAVLLLVFAYHPTHFLFGRSSEITNARQMVTAVRLHRVMAIECALAAFLLTLTHAQESETAKNIIIVSIFAVEVITYYIFRFKFLKAD